MTKIEKFVKDKLVHINRPTGEIDYLHEGNMYQEPFRANPLDAIRMAIKSVDEQEDQYLIWKAEQTTWRGE